MSEWISVEERYPEAGERCICSDGSDIEMMIFYGLIEGYAEWSSYSCNTIDVTHWMPLPNLPK